MAIRIFGRERKRIDLRYPDFDLLPEADQRRIVMKIRQELAEEHAAIQRMSGDNQPNRPALAASTSSPTQTSKTSDSALAVSSSAVSDSPNHFPQKPNTQCRSKRKHKTTSRYRQSWYRRRW